MPASSDNEGRSIFTSDDVSELRLTDTVKGFVTTKGLGRHMYIPQWKVDTLFNIDEEVQNSQDHLWQMLPCAVRIFAYLGVFV